MKIQERLTVISASLKPFVLTYILLLIIYITHSHSLISLVLKTDTFPNFHFCHNPTSETFTYLPNVSF